MTNNRIPKQQNEPKSIELLAASSRFYALGKRALAVQICFTVGLSVVLAVATLLSPDFKIWATFSSIAIALFDVAVIDRIQGHYRKYGALAQEQLDCSLFGIPWNELKAGKPLEPEDVRRAAARFLTLKGDGKLRDWYPASIAELPLSSARTICQRSCFRWDSSQRRLYGFWLLGIALAAILAVSIAGICRAQSLQAFVMVAYAPIAPAVLWAFREYRRQKDASDSLVKSQTFVNGVWKRMAREELSEQELSATARQIQDVLFENRSKSPMVFNWIYEKLRDQHEEEMRDAAVQFISELPPSRTPKED